MVAIKVTIDRFIDEDQPGRVACSFVDAAGVLHLFEEKVPVVSDEDLDPKSEYPRPGVIGCEMISVRWAADGHELVLVDTEKPGELSRLRVALDSRSTGISFSSGTKDLADRVSAYDV
jgi:hypothetical protein